jgi:hypothetical protein
MLPKKPFIIVSSTIFLFLSFNLPAQVKPAPSTAKSTETDLQLAKGYLQVAVNDLRDMTAIYQAMYAMLKQALDSRKDEMKEMRLDRERKFNAAKSAAEAKREEIRKKIEAARDQYISACSTAVAQCVATTGSIASSSRKLQTSARIPPSEFFRTYHEDIERVFKKSLILQEDIKKLVKDRNEYSYTPNQKRKMHVLAAELAKIIRHGGKSINTAMDMAARINQEITRARQVIPKR